MKSKILLLVIGLVVVILGAGIYVAFKTGLIKPSADVTGPVMALAPSTGTFDIGSNFDVAIQLDTVGQAVSGAQAYLNYNPDQLEVVQITPGTIFNNYMPDELSSGKIVISAIALQIADFNGSGVFASIRFKALTAGASEITFDFAPGDTRKTSAAKAVTGENILASVTNGSYTIQGPPPPTPTVNIKANSSDGPIEIDSGTAANLSWAATPEGAICSASGGWSGSKSLTGTESTGNLTQAKIYTLTCANSAGSASDSVTVNIKNTTPLPDVKVRVNGQKQVTIESGGSVALTWTSTNATTCMASGSWSGTQSISGNVKLGPFTQAKVYTLTCQNTAGSVHDKALVYIKNQPAPVIPTTNIKANNSDEPITIDYDTAATLSWVSTNADACTASNGWKGGKAVSGTESTGNLTKSKTYTLTCKKGEESAVDSVTVNVTGQPPAEPGPSDGNQISEAQTETPPGDGTITQLPGKVTSTAKPADKTQELYKGGGIKPWAKWVLFALIPLSLTAGIIFFYLKRKREKNIKSSISDLSNTPTNWPNS